MVNIVINYLNTDVPYSTKKCCQLAILYIIVYTLNLDSESSNLFSMMCDIFPL